MPRGSRQPLLGWARSPRRPRPLAPGFFSGACGAMTVRGVGGDDGARRRDRRRLSHLSSAIKVFLLLAVSPDPAPGGCVRWIHS